MFYSLCGEVKAQSPNWDSVYADYFKIYQPTDTPAWLFPICFKNALAEWDTLYIGHDPTATSGWFDTQFGEGFVQFNLSELNATLGFQADTGFKVVINKINFNNGFSIDLINGIMPLTMYWNDALFYSDSLPFPDLSPLPNVRIDLWCDDVSIFYMNCPVNVPLYLSDSNFFGGIGPNTRIDSIYFDGNGIDDMPGTLWLEIVAFNKSLATLKTNQGPLGFKVHPTPAHDHITISSVTTDSYKVELYNLLGERLYESDWSGIDEMRIDLMAMDRGLYLLVIKTESGTFTQKIIHL